MLGSLTNVLPPSGAVKLAYLCDLAGGDAMRTRDKVVQLIVCALLVLIAAGCVFGRVAFSPDGKRIATVITQGRERVRFVSLSTPHVI